MLHIRNWILKLCCLITMAMSLGGFKQGRNPAAVLSSDDRDIDEGDIVFRLVPGSSRQAEVGTEATFLFRNDTHRVVNLPSYYLEYPMDGVLKVSFAEYEFQQADKWKSLDIGYCGIAQYNPVPPDNELRLQIDLGPFEHRQMSGDTPLRVKLAEFTSEVFTLNDTIGAKKEPGHRK